MHLRPIARVACGGAMLWQLAGCATVATIQSADAGTAKLFSGTRLDWLAATDRPTTAPLFRTAPPPIPWLDLPFSFVLDIIVLPLTATVRVPFGP